MGKDFEMCFFWSEDNFYFKFKIASCIIVQTANLAL
jgi:hypothetical protein